MAKITLSDSKISTLVNALGVARDQYTQDAATARQPYDDSAALETLPEGWERMALGFEQQAKECGALIDELEQAGDDA